MAELPVFSPGYDGLGFTTQQGAVAGDQFENTGDTVLWLQNNGVATITVTLTPDFDPAGLLFAPVQVVVAAGQIRLVGKLLRQWWDDGAGRVVLTYSGVSGLSVGVMHLGSQQKYVMTGFAPSALAGLILWLDASHSASLFQDDGGATPVTTNNDPVGRWADRSGVGNHVIQATTTAQPTYQTNVQNGLPGLLFDGGDYLDGVGVQASFPLTLMGVAKQSATVGTTRGLCSLYSTITFGSRVQLSSANAVLWTTATPSATRTAPGAIAANAAFIFGGRASAIDVLAMSNQDFSTLAGHTAGVVSNIIRVGGSNVNSTVALMNGFICEVLAWNSALTAWQMQRVAQYLNAKWGVY